MHLIKRNKEETHKTKARANFKLKALGKYTVTSKTLEKQTK